MADSNLKTLKIATYTNNSYNNFFINYTKQIATVSKQCLQLTRFNRAQLIKL